VPNLRSYRPRAGSVSPGLPVDAVFIGGGMMDDGVFVPRGRLKSGGRLVQRRNRRETEARLAFYFQPFGEISSYGRSQ